MDENSTVSSAWSPAYCCTFLERSYKINAVPVEGTQGPLKCSMVTKG